MPTRVSRVRRGSEKSNTRAGRAWRASYAFTLEPVPTRDWLELFRDLAGGSLGWVDLQATGISLMVEPDRLQFILEEISELAGACDRQMSDIAAHPEAFEEFEREADRAIERLVLPGQD